MAATQRQPQVRNIRYGSELIDDPIIAEIMAYGEKFRRQDADSLRWGREWTNYTVQGVEVSFYLNWQQDCWNASVLADRNEFPDHDALPKVGNRPRVDSGTSRWWWDPSKSAGWRDWQEPTIEEARQDVIRQVNAILRELWFLMEAPKFMQS